MTLMDKIEKDSYACIKAMSEAAHEIDWSNPYVYAHWLAQSFHYVRHATRVLAWAAAKCKLEEEFLHLKLLEGIGEEKGHELLALRDMKSMGYDIKDFPEWPETSAYYQSLYYNIESDGPAALLGYFLPLEGLAAVGLKKVCDTVLEKYGNQGGSFIKVHCKVDSGHFKEGLEFLGQLSPAHQEALYRNMKMSAELYINILKKVITMNDKKAKKGA